MIRLEYVLRRLSNLSLEDFQDYWHNTHGPLVAKHQTNLKILKYVQLHTISDPVNDAMRKSRGAMKAYDGVEEFWWENLEELETVLSSEEGAKAFEDLIDDERAFIDFSGSNMWLAMELPQINPLEEIIATEKSTFNKSYFCFHHIPQLSLEEAQLYWRMNHGPIVRSYAQAAGILRYIQVHRVDVELTDKLRDPRGIVEQPFTGHAEAWFDRTEGKARFGTPEGRKAFDIFIEDERNFIDLPRGATWLCKEHVFVDRR